MAEATKKTGNKQKIDKQNKPNAQEIAHEDVQENNQVDDQVVVTEVEAVATKGSKPTKAVAKAGKRSTKALNEAKAIEAKEARKAQTTSEHADKPKPHTKPARPRIERRSKKFRELATLVDKNKAYALSEAVELAVKTSPVKFDATVELHVNLNVDPKHADQNVRDNLVLPAGTGKNVRIAVFADTEDATAAQKTGADVVGVEAVIKLLDKSQLDFDVLISTPSQMPKLGKYARILGPKGLMPNPKSGTVTTDIVKAVKDAKAGRIEYRVDSTGIVHLGVGKVSFGKDKILENVQAVLASIKSNKPASVKSGYIKTVHLTTTMGPSITTLLE